MKKVKKQKEVRPMLSSPNVRDLESEGTSEKPPNYSEISLKPEYWKMVEWQATFSPQRNPKSIEELAKTFDMSARQLQRWKTMPEYRQDLLKGITPKALERITDVIHSWLYRLTQESTAADIKLAAQMFLKWQEILGIESPSLDGLAEDVKKILTGEGIDSPKTRKGKHDRSIKLGH